MIHDVAHGVACFAPRGGTLGIEVDASTFESLTCRELEAMLLICDGKAGPEIARAMGVTINTVKHFVRNIYLKYGVRNRHQAIVRHLEITRGGFVTIGTSPSG